MIANISQSLAPHHGGKNSWHNSDMGWRNYVTVTITYMYVSVFRNIFNHDTLPKLIRSRHERRRCYRVVRWDRLFSHNTGRTDRRTDWQTDGNAIASTALAMRALRRAVKTNNSQYSQCVYHTLCQCIISRTFAYKINKKFNDDDEDWRLLITQFSSHPCSSNIYMYLQKTRYLYFTWDLGTCTRTGIWRQRWVKLSLKRFQIKIKIVCPKIKIKISVLQMISNQNHV